MKNKKIIYDKEFIQAILEKLKELDLSLGYLYQPKHPNCEDKTKHLPINGSQIARILKPKTSLVGDKSLYKLMKWCKVKSLQIQYENDLGKTLKTIILK